MINKLIRILLILFNLSEPRYLRNRSMFVLVYYNKIKLETTKYHIPNLILIHNVDHT